MPNHTASHCRFYKNNVPTVGELVMVTIRKFNKSVGFYVELDEYENHEALLNISHTVSGRVRKSLTSIIPINSKQVASVISVVPASDGSKSKIDVSLKNINKEESERFAQLFKQEKRLSSAMRKLSYLSDIPILDLYQNIVWNNFNKDALDSMHAIDALYLHMDELSISDEYREILSKYHYKVFGPVIHALKRSFMLVSFENDGSHKVSRTLQTLLPTKKYTNKELNADDSKYNMIIRPIALPQYEVVITSSSTKTNSDVLSSVKSVLESLVADDTGYLLID